MKRVQVAAGIIKQDKQFFVCRRQAHQHQGGKWEFPGGKVESTETSLEALSRELYEEVGIRLNDAELLTEIRHDYPDKRVHLQFFLVEDFDGAPHGKEGQSVGWFSLEVLKQLEFPEANKQVLEIL